MHDRVVHLSTPNGGEHEKANSVLSFLPHLTATCVKQRRRPFNIDSLSSSRRVGINIDISAGLWDCQFHNPPSTAAATRPQRPEYWLEIVRKRAVPRELLAMRNKPTLPTAMFKAEGLRMVIFPSVPASCVHICHRHAANSHLQGGTAHEVGNRVYCFAQVQFTSLEP